jgi:tetratricopeptide (TPR) repeat protein
LLAAFLLLAFVQTGDYEKGVVLFEKGDAAGAVLFLARAAEANPRDARAWKALGVAWAAQSAYAQAEPAFRRACDLDPKLEDACYYEARALYALDRYQPSLEVLQQLDTKPAKVRLAIAEDLEALGRASEAETEFKAATALGRGAEPQSGIAYGRFLVRQGRFSEAVAPLEAVLQRFPNSAEAYIHLGRALLEQGKLSEAIARLERAVALDATSVQAHLLLANAYVRAGRSNDAQPHFEAARRGQ